ncbi:Methyltransferase-like protein 16 [Linnemannia schmuckeri]|uniref:U6 small nuclear RNA (adenine-(43)-N(6))-methyltransferase n=1 Tax=Linnemannia schmuckeri TaxID=64567 RepID=A0A9P5S2A0_9FUNG|nr:Methyltransferase-like protein 16 [Linnemannia schmuckeri]
MSKRKLVETGMHPNNPYFNNPPDFVALAQLYPSLAPFVAVKSSESSKGTSGSGTRGIINFQDPSALRELTYCLLKKDFSLDLEIPLDSLCPPIPNRLNYICWIEDLLDIDSTKDIHGIDIGTGASCIYPLLGCSRNMHWKMVATDIDDRSISFADSNVKRNHLDNAIRIIKNNSTDIFLALLFKDPEQRYDFCMCNPPFYKDEQDIQDSLEGKEGQASAVCNGTINEMITAGGETQFVKQMVDESIVHGQRIRWYTSMLGKRSSVDTVIAYLKEKKILNYTLTTFRQGRTRRWAIAWSHGNAHASRASMQHISNKMIKLTPPKTILSFQCKGSTVKTILRSIENLLDGLLIQHRSGATDSETDSTMVRVLHCTAERNTWSRAARRALARESAEKGGEKSGSKTAKEVADSALAPVVLEFDIRVSLTFQSTCPEVQSSSTSKRAATPAQASHMIEFTWTIGEDRALFESCFLHFRNKFQQDHTTMQEQAP